MKFLINVSIIFVSLMLLSGTELSATTVDATNYAPKKTINATYGWYTGPMYICDYNNYDVFYSRNYYNGAHTYQYTSLDSDKYSPVASTKYKSTAEVQRGAKKSYTVSYRDYY